MSGDIDTDSLPPVALGRHGGITILKGDTTVAFVSDRRLYLTADRSAVVEEGDAGAAYLLVGVGGEVPTSVAKQYGLKAPSKQPPDDSPPAAKDPADAEDLDTIQAEAKAVEPAANKAVLPKSDK